MKKKEIIKKVLETSSKPLADIDWEYYWIGKYYSERELEEMTDRQLSILVALVREVGEYYY